MGGKLNVNTASLQALELIPGIDENAAAHILQQRAGPDGIDGTDDDLPFQNIGQINGSSVSGTPQNGRAAQGLAAYIDVRSYIFQVRVDAEINQHTNTYYGIISRSGNGAQQLKCVKFYWQ
jgi:hypothetical protein